MLGGAPFVIGWWMPISDFITKTDAFNLMAGGGVTETRSAASRTELEVNEYNLIEKNTGK